MQHIVQYSRNTKIMFDGGYEPGWNAISSLVPGYFFFAFGPDSGNQCSIVLDGEIRDLDNLDIPGGLVFHMSR